MFSINCDWKGFLRCSFLGGRAHFWPQHFFKATDTQQFAPVRCFSRYCCTLWKFDVICSCRGLGLCILALCLTSLRAGSSWLRIWQKQPWSALTMPKPTVLKVSSYSCALASLGLEEVGRFAKMVVLMHPSVATGSLGEHAQAGQIPSTGTPVLRGPSCSSLFQLSPW